MQKQEDATTQLSQGLKEMSQRVDQLSAIVQRLAFELQRERDNAERDREIQRLRLENILLQFERTLPPAGRPEGEGKA